MRLSAQDMNTSAPNTSPNTSALNTSALNTSALNTAQQTPRHPLLRYQHPLDQRVAEVEHHEREQVWSVTLSQGEQRRVHGLYPSLASAQLILTALGFKELYQAREASA